MGIYDNCSSTCLWEGYLLDFALRTVIKKKLYIGIYEKKNIDYMPYIDLKKNLQGFCLGIDCKIN